MRTLLVIFALVACAAAAPSDKRDRRWVSDELHGVEVGYPALTYAQAPQLLTVNKVVNTARVVDVPQVVNVRKVVAVPEVVSVNKLVAAPALYSTYSTGWW